MKTFTYKLLLRLFLVFLGMGVSCGEKDELTPVEKMKKILIGDGARTWKIKSVTIDGAQTTMFSGMTIKFSENVYTATKGGLIWPSQDTWEFTDSQATALFRGDGIEVQVVATENILILSLEWTKTTYGGGRVNSISGHHVFEFNL